MFSKESHFFGLLCMAFTIGTTAVGTVVVATVSLITLEIGTLLTGFIYILTPHISNYIHVA